MGSDQFGTQAYWEREQLLDDQRKAERQIEDADDLESDRVDAHPLTQPAKSSLQYFAQGWNDGANGRPEMSAREIMSAYPAWTPEQVEQYANGLLDGASGELDRFIYATCAR